MSHDWFMEREKKVLYHIFLYHIFLPRCQTEDGSTCFTHPEINACSPDVESILFLQSWCHFMLGRGITHVKDTFQGIYKPTAPTLFPYGNIQMHSYKEGVCRDNYIQCFSAENIYYLLQA